VNWKETNKQKMKTMSIKSINLLRSRVSLVGALGHNFRYFHLKWISNVPRHDIFFSGIIALNGPLFVRQISMNMEKNASTTKKNIRLNIRFQNRARQRKKLKIWVTVPLQLYPSAETLCEEHQDIRNHNHSNLEDQTYGINRID
jgi:hypothetical protein